MATDGQHTDAEKSSAKGGASTAATAADTTDRAELAENVQAQLGEKLQEAYADVINAPVPDRFLQLLDQLESSSSHKGEA